MGFRGEIQRVPEGFQEPHLYSLPSRIGSATRGIVSASTCHLSTETCFGSIISATKDLCCCKLALVQIRGWTSGALKCHLKTEMIARLNQKFDEDNSPRMIRKNVQGSKENPQPRKIRDTTPRTSLWVPQGFRDVQEGFCEGFREVGAHSEGFRGKKSCETLSY